MARQWALGLKSDPRATGTPSCINARAGGGLRRRLKAVVGNSTPTVPARAMALMPSSDTSSKWLIAKAPISAPILKQKMIIVTIITINCEFAIIFLSSKLKSWFNIYSQSMYQMIYRMVSTCSPSCSSYKIQRETVSPNKYFTGNKWYNCPH